jgi:hypothetical protein
VGVSGDTFTIADTSAVTLGNIIGVSSVYDSSCAISINIWGTFSGVKVVSTTIGSNVYTGSNSVITGNIVGLTANTSYTFSIYAKNSYNTYSRTVYTATYSTLADIASATITPNTYYSFNLTWSLNGSSTNVIVAIYTSTDGISYSYNSVGGTTSATTTGYLSANTLYYVRLTPTVSGVSGSHFYVSNYTYGNIISTSTSNITISGGIISAIGYFNKVFVHNTATPYIDTSYTAV